MGKILFFLFTLLLLPGLIIGHMTTDVPTFEFAINIFVAFIFIANLIMLALSFGIAKRIPQDKLLHLREHARQNKWRQYVVFITSTVLIFALFSYVNSFAGTLYLLAFVMVQITRANVLHYFGPLNLRK